MRHRPCNIVPNRIYAYGRGWSGGAAAERGGAPGGLAFRPSLFAPALTPSREIAVHQETIARTVRIELTRRIGDNCIEHLSTPPRVLGHVERDKINYTLINAVLCSSTDDTRYFIYTPVVSRRFGFPTKGGVPLPRICLPSISDPNAHAPK